MQDLRKKLVNMGEIMKRFWGFITTIMLIICMAGSSLAAESVSQEVLDSTKSVVRIYVSYGDAGYATGSGFVVSSDENNTYVLTNYHVAVEDNPEYIAVILNSEADIQASVLCADKDHDLALLKIAFPLGMTPICFCKDAPSKGEAVYAIGFPGAADAFTETIALGSEDSTITDGIISAIRSVPLFEGGPNVRILQISAAINSGNSGGPLLNQKGEVIGIDTYAVEDSQGIFGAISESEIKAFLQVNNITYYVHAEQKDSGVPVWKIVVAVVGVGIVILVIVIIFKKKRNEKYESFDVISTEEGCDNDTARKEKRAQQKKSIRTVLIVVGVLLVVTVAGYLTTYILANQAIDKGDYHQAKELLFAKKVTQMHDAKIIEYIEASELAENGDCEGALSKFEVLKASNYKDSQAQVDYLRTVIFNRAVNYYNAGNNKDAERLFKNYCTNAETEKYLTLIEIKHKLETNENIDYAETSQNLNKILDFEDAKQVLYLVAQRAYREDHLDIAKDMFEKLSIERSDDYHRLIEAKELLEIFKVATNNTSIDLFYQMRRKYLISELEKMGDFEDAQKVLKSLKFTLAERNDSSGIKNERVSGTEVRLYQNSMLDEDIRDMIKQKQ